MSCNGDYFKYHYKESLFSAATAASSLNNYFITDPPYSFHNYGYDKSFYQNMLTSTSTAGSIINLIATSPRPDAYYPAFGSSKSIYITGRPIEILADETFKININTPPAVGAIDWKTAKASFDGTRIKINVNFNAINNEPTTIITKIPIANSKTPYIEVVEVVCRCDTQSLMRHGCQCGCIPRETLEKKKFEQMLKTMQQENQRLREDNEKRGLLLTCRCEMKLLMLRGCKCGGR